MEIYKTFFDARRYSSEPLYARIDGKGCWLAREPEMLVLKSASFRALLRKGPSDRLIRNFKLGKVDQYYTSVCLGMGADSTANFYSSEQQAQQDFEDAVSRHDGNSHWQRV
jgi:hypothetical protein